MVKKRNNCEKDSIVALSFPVRRSFNFAHVLTSVRLVLTPVFLVVIETGYRQSTLLNALTVVVLFLLICASDYYDGPVARALGVDSDFGKVLDNLADITFLLVTLTFLVHIGTTPWWIPTAIALAFGQYTVDSWLLAGRKTDVVLVSNPIGHWAGILNYIGTGVVALHTASQQLLPQLLLQSFLVGWLLYLLLAMAMRLRFFLRIRGARSCT
ncbi:MAG: CDP-alcohol phosphatidyltransferase family protein [Deltaproteobacteria bacterium]|nr:CDP-alcohol phosphatidyltransferase family protein [Deltaproteobacteria bacterium]